MATDPEALTQLSRLLGEELSPGTTSTEVQHAVEQRFEVLTRGLIAEAAASDDVFDRESAMAFLEARLFDLRTWLTDDQRSRLRDALRGKIESW